MSGRLSLLLRPPKWFEDRIEVTSGIIIGPMRSGKTTTVLYWMWIAEQYAMDRDIPFLGVLTNNLYEALLELDAVEEEQYIFFFVDDSSGYTDWSVVSRNPEYAEVYLEIAHEMEDRGMRRGLIFCVFANQYIHKVAPVFRVNSAFTGLKSLMMRKAEEYNEARKMLRRKARYLLRRQTYELMVLRTLEAKARTYLVWPDRKVTVTVTPLYPPKPSNVIDFREPASRRRSKRDEMKAVAKLVLTLTGGAISANQALKLVREVGLKVGNKRWFDAFKEARAEFPVPVISIGRGEKGE